MLVLMLVLQLVHLLELLKVRHLAHVKGQQWEVVMVIVKVHHLVRWLGQYWVHWMGQPLEVVMVNLTALRLVHPLVFSMVRHLVP